MSSVGKATPITLTDAERSELEGLARSTKSEYRLRQRAQIVLLAAQGLATRAVARHVGCTTGTASKWRVRYAARRLAEPVAADVVRDRDQPVVRAPRTRALLQCAVRVHEGRLRHVLGVRRVAEDRERVAVDVRGVTPVEPLEEAVRTRPLREQERHGH